MRNCHSKNRLGAQRAHLGKERDTFQTLGLEDGHDGFDDLVVVVAQRLILENIQKRVDRHSLVVVIGGRRCASEIPRRGVGQIGGDLVGSLLFMLDLSPVWIQRTEDTEHLDDFPPYPLTEFRAQNSTQNLQQLRVLHQRRDHVSGARAKLTECVQGSVALMQ